MEQESFYQNLGNKLVLMYHDVLDDSSSTSGFSSVGANYYKIAKDSFEQQMAYLSSFAGKDNVILTFDDGGSSCLDVIAPILNKYSLKGYFFIATDWVGKDGFLTIQQIERLAQMGHYVGSHSCSHPKDMCSLSLEQRYDEWYNSLKSLREVLHSDIEIISIPNGYFLKNDHEFLTGLGVKVAFTSTIKDYQTFGSDFFIKGRVAIDHTTSFVQFLQILNKGVFYKKLLAKQSVILILKSILGRLYEPLIGKIRNYIK